MVSILINYEKLNSQHHYSSFQCHMIHDIYSPHFLFIPIHSHINVQLAGLSCSAEFIMCCRVTPVLLHLLLWEKKDCCIRSCLSTVLATTSCDNNMLSF